MREARAAGKNLDNIGNEVFYEGFTFNEMLEVLAIKDAKLYAEFGYYNRDLQFSNMIFSVKEGKLQVTYIDFPAVNLRASIIQHFDITIRYLFGKRLGSVDFGSGETVAIDGSLYYKAYFDGILKEYGVSPGYSILIRVKERIGYRLRYGIEDTTPEVNTGIIYTRELDATIKGYLDAYLEGKSFLELTEQEILVQIRQ